MAGNEYAAIGAALNPYEIISTSIELGVIDFELYKRVQRSTVIGLWKHADTFIFEVRKKPNHERKFIELQNLVDWFEKPRIAPRSRWRNIFY